VWHHCARIAPLAVCMNLHGKLGHVSGFRLSHCRIPLSHRDFHPKQRPRMKTDMENLGTRTGFSISGRGRNSAL
jgi:hypothetical protein